MATEKPKTFNKKSFIINLLRRGTFRWPPRSQAKKAAWVSRGLYKCASCKEVFRDKDTKIDHIEPVVDPKTGFTTWDDWINRAFPDDFNKFQILCSQCHDSKTAVEKEVRKTFRQKRKKML